MTNKISFNEKQSRYEMAVDGLTVFADIRLDGDVLYINYVEAPPELRGSGAAGKFMDGLMQNLRAQKLKAVPICGYAASWLRRHSEYKDLLAE